MNDPSGHCASTTTIDLVCYTVLAEAAAAATATVVGGGGAAVIIGVGLYGYQNTTFDLPDYDHSYDIPGTDILASHPVNGSSTVSSGVPVIQNENEGFTLVDPPRADKLIVPANDRPAKYGPYYRIKSPTQTTEDAMKIESSGLLKGGGANGSTIPSAKAHTRLPANASEYMEIYTDVEPSSISPNYVYWHAGYPGVSVEGDQAVIPVVVTKNTQK